MYIYIDVDYIENTQLRLQEIISGEDGSACHIPGGFGACGGPNDGWHQFLHVLTRAYLRTVVKWSGDAEARQGLEELCFNVQALPEAKSPMTDSIRADAWALHQLGTKQSFGHDGHVCFRLRISQNYIYIYIFTVYMRIDYIYIYSNIYDVLVLYMYIFTYLYVYDIIGGGMCHHFAPQAWHVHLVQLADKRVLFQGFTCQVAV